MPGPVLAAVAAAGLALVAALLVGLLMLAAGSALGPAVAIAGAVAVLSGTLAWLHARDAVRVTRYLRALAPGGTDPAPPVASTALGQALAGSIGQLLRATRHRERDLAERLAAAATIVEALHDPVLVLTANRSVVSANAAALRLFGDRLVGRDLADGLRHPDVLAAVDAVLAGGGSRTVPMTVPVPVAQVFEVRIARFDREAPGEPDDGAPSRPAALVTLHDITAVKRSEQMRADFVANASHELRTPLATLTGFIETLRGPARDDAAARDRFLGIMQEQAGRMSRLVHDLLSLSRIELDEHLPPTGTVDLARILSAVVDALEIKAAARRKELVLNLRDALPPVAGDPDQLHQVFQNLVDNAISYSHPDTPVTVTAWTERSRQPTVVVTVADRGDGIPKAHLPRLTERFYRVDPARSRAIGGTGLGLAIVKHIVSRHRGRIEADSRVGEGSVFTVTLPAAPTKERPAVAPEKGRRTVIKV